MKNLNLNLGKMISLRGTSLVLVGSLLIGGLTSCGLNVKCELPNKHAHMYVNEDGYVRYIASEDSSYDGYARSYNYRELSEEDSQLYKFLNRNGLLRIDENIDLILEQQERNMPFIAYEYAKTELASVGRALFTTTRYYWTYDSEATNLTGKEKEVHYLYQAYKVEKNEKGKYILVSSDMVEDITEVMEDYPYVKRDYYVVADEHNVKVDVTDLKEKEKIIVSGDTEKTLKKVID